MLGCEVHSSAMHGRNFFIEGRNIGLRSKKICFESDRRVTCNGSSFINADDKLEFLCLSLTSKHIETHIHAKDCLLI